MLKEQKWQLQEAKAQFSHLVDLVEKGESICITRHGEEVAILISRKRYDQFTKKKKGLLECLLSSPYPEVNLDTSRSKEPLRDLDL